MKKRLIKPAITSILCVVCLIISAYAWFTKNPGNSIEVILQSGEAKNAITAELYIGNDWDYDGELDRYIEEDEHGIDVEIPYEEQTMTQINAHFYEQANKTTVNQISDIYDLRKITFKFVINSSADTPIDLSFFLIGLLDDTVYNREAMMFSLNNVHIISYKKDVYQGNTLYKDYIENVDYHEIEIDEIRYNLWELSNREEYLENVSITKSETIEVVFWIECLEMRASLDFYNNYYYDLVDKYFSLMLNNIADDVGVTSALQAQKDAIVTFLDEAYLYISTNFSLPPPHPLPPTIDLDNLLLLRDKLNLEGKTALNTLAIYINDSIEELTIMYEKLEELRQLRESESADLKLIIKAFAINATWRH